MSLHTEQKQKMDPAAWAPSKALDKLSHGYNNSPCILTDGPVEFNDTPLYRDPHGRIAALEREVGVLTAKLEQEQQGHLETIEERDRYHERADDLAAAIGSLLGKDFGEHTSANHPWERALDAAKRSAPLEREVEALEAEPLSWIRWAVIDPSGEPKAFVIDRKFAEDCAIVDNRQAQSLGKPTGYHVMQVKVAPNMRRPAMKTNRPLFRFDTRVYVTHWDRAHPVTVVAHTRDEAVKKVREMMGKPASHDSWAVRIVSAEEILDDSQ